MSYSLNLNSTSADGLWHDEEETGEWGIPISTSNAKGFHFDNAKLSRRMLLPIFLIYYYSELPSFFLLILKYNTKDSDIVKEAKRQTLMRPKLLKDAGKLNDTDVIW
jgi:hypothetical protein